MLELVSGSRADGAEAAQQKLERLVVSHGILLAIEIEHANGGAGNEL